MDVNSTYIPEDYDELLKHYKDLRKELDENKQNLYDSTRQIKLNEALLREYQSEIESIQSGENLIQEKLEAKIATLEESIVNLRLTHSEAISNLEGELEKKQQEVECLQNELDLMKRKHSIEPSLNYSQNNDDFVTLKNENELLNERYNELLEAFQNSQEKQDQLLETLEQFKEEVSQLKETLEVKKVEISEKNTLIEKLNDEILCVNRELENYKNKPLDDKSKGNSLFAEVDDRRVHLQKTVNDMKYEYIQMKQDKSQYLKQISHLRKENTSFREMWEKDLVQIREDQQSIVDSLKDHIHVLEERIKKYQTELEDKRKVDSDDLCAEYKFYQDMIDSRSDEIKKLEQKLSERCVNDYMKSKALAQANQEIRQLRIDIINLQQKLEEKHETDKEKKNENKDAQSLDMPKVNNKDEGLLNQQKIFLKSALKTRNTRDTNIVAFSKNYNFEKTELKTLIGDVDTKLQISSNESQRATNFEDTTKESSNESVNLITFEDKENFVKEDNISQDIGKKGVSFSDNTLDSSSVPVRRRGTRVFSAPKKIIEDTS